MGNQRGFNPEELLLDEIIIDKLDAARRQLESAITMLFQEWDVVSQHTLIAAAHGILHDLAKKEGIKGSIKDSPLIRPEKQKEFIDAIHLPQNFFKHGDKDAGTKIAFRYNVSHHFLFDAVRLFVLLKGNPTYEMKVFFMWFQLRYPDLICFEHIEKYLIKIRESTKNPKTFMVLARKLLEDSMK
jgi:hypothetical protein